MDTPWHPRHGRDRMISIAYVVVLAGASASVSGRAAVETQKSAIFAQLQVKRQSIIRVPSAAAPKASKPIKWKEKKAPACIAWSRLAAAMISSPSTIDVVVRGGARYRVKLEKSCQAIDFYSGFYVKATRDGQVCEDRDMIHSRSGGACAIDTFKTLVAAK